MIVTDQIIYILAVLASGTTGFFLGWLIFGFALAGFYESNMVHYDGLIRPFRQRNMD